MPNSSSDAPLFESRIATSSRLTSPRSPCSESAGWRNEAGLPVEVKVAAIFRPMSPDLPRPETIRRPLAPARSLTAVAKAGPSCPATRRIASASRASTRRPRSARSLGSMRDFAVLLEVLRDQVLPLAAGLEDQLRHFAHRALAARHRGDQSRGGLHLGDAVRHGDRQADPCQHRKVGEIIAHEGALVPGKATARQQGLEHRELASRRLLDQLIHGQLARPQGGRGGFPTRHPHDGEPRRAEHADAEAVLDVEALELDRVVADHAHIEAVVREYAVDVESDELQAAGEGGVEHRVPASNGATHGLLPAPAVTSHAHCEHSYPYYAEYIISG